MIMIMKTCSPRYIYTTYIGFIYAISINIFDDDDNDNDDDIFIIMNDEC